MSWVLIQELASRTFSLSLTSMEKSGLSGVCVCVFACVRECVRACVREREREREKTYVYMYVYI
jgi:hypothetical protein